MRRAGAAGILLLMAFVACKSQNERAQDLVERGKRSAAAGDCKSAIGSFEDALRLAPRSESAFLGRADSWTKLGDGEKAAKSLERCDSAACSEERRRLAAAVLKQTGKPPFSTEADLRRFLQLTAFADGSPRCAWAAAIGTTGEATGAWRQLLLSEAHDELDRLKNRLGSHAVGPNFEMAESAGEGAVTAKSCDDVRRAATPLLETIKRRAADSEYLKERESNDLELANAAFDLGLLSAGLRLLAEGPGETQGLAKMPLRSPDDLKLYLDTAGKAGNPPYCAVFMAILRVEQLPARDRAAVRAALKASIAALTPPNVTEYALLGRDVVPLELIASAEQSCGELDDAYKQFTAAQVKIGAATVESGERAAPRVDRAMFMYTALRTRFERPASRRSAEDRDGQRKPLPPKR